MKADGLSRCAEGMLGTRGIVDREGILKPAIIIVSSF